MGSRKRGPKPGIQPRHVRTEEVNSRVSERPVSDENARRSDAGMPDVSPADNAGDRPAPAPPAPARPSVRIPPRPSAPPTSAMPFVPRSTTPADATPVGTAAAGSTPSSTAPAGTTPPNAAPATASSTPAPETDAPTSAAPASRRATARTQAQTGAESRATPSAAPRGRVGVKTANRQPPNRKTASGASQLGRLLSAKAAQFKAADLGPRTRLLGGRLGTGAGRLGTGAGRLGRTLWAGAHRLGLAKVGAALAAVVVLGLVIWWLTSLGTPAQRPTADNAPAPAGSSSAAPATRGPLPLEGVNPMDFRLGDCFKDFDANAPTATVVACDTGHSAQLVAVDNYAAADAYPGRDPLKQKALDTCKAAQLTDTSGKYQFSYKLAYPSSSSWGTGDRRVDCYFVADGGNVIQESLIPRL